MVITRGLRMAEDDKLNHMATIVITFMRRTVVLRLVLTSRYTRELNSLRARRRRLSRQQSALRDRSNTVGARLGGRPRKRKRAGGRPPATPPDPLVSSAEGLTTPIPSHVSRFMRYLRRRNKQPLFRPFSKLPAVVQQRLKTLSFANRTPLFVPQRRGRKRSGKKTADGMQIGGVIHRHVSSKSLQSRRGRRVALRSKCVSCYANAPTPEGGGRKLRTSTGVTIPHATYACDVCRVLLCKDCFWNVYDHRDRGKQCDFVVLR